MDKIILEAKREVLIQYYNKISIDKLSVDNILDAIEADMEYLKQEIALAEAKELIKQKLGTYGSKKRSGRHPYEAGGEGRHWGRNWLDNGFEHNINY